jgi:hypothetical protein
MHRILYLTLITLGLVSKTCLAIPPAVEKKEVGFSLDHVSQDCPIIYDNDWWTDVPDAVYLWVKASQNQCSVRGNIVSRDMWEWQNGYTFKLEDGLKDCRELIANARASGLKNIPDPTIGSNEALRRPENGKIEDTKFQRTAGSDLIVAEALKASPTKPLLIFCGGPCTTVATAYLTDPKIVDHIIVFQIDGGAYNGKDNWAWQIVEQRCRFANWARGYFWPQLGKWNPESFAALPKNPVCDALRRYAFGDLAKDNQWGDGAWIFWLFDRKSLTTFEIYDDVGLTIPKEGVNADAMQREFFRTLMDAKVYDADGPSQDR